MTSSIIVAWTLVRAIHRTIRVTGNKYLVYYPITKTAQDWLLFIATALCPARTKVHVIFLIRNCTHRQSLSHLRSYLRQPVKQPIKEGVRAIFDRTSRLERREWAVSKSFAVVCYMVQRKQDAQITPRLGSSRIESHPTSSKRDTPWANIAKEPV